MKAIIEGKRYDTETATLIGEATSRGYPSNDFHYWQEALYRTKNGRFFLAGEGGALSRYSRGFGQNGSTGGSKIIPLDAGEARDWCEQYCTAEVIETVFAAEIEDA